MHHDMHDEILYVLLRSGRYHRFIGIEWERVTDDAPTLCIGSAVPVVNTEREAFIWRNKDGKECVTLECRLRAGTEERHDGKIRPNTSDPGWKDKSVHYITVRLESITRLAGAGLVIERKRSGIPAPLRAF